MFVINKLYTMRVKRSLVWALPWLLVGSMTSCASFRHHATPEDVVRELAAKRWTSLIAGDFDSAYDYLQPSIKQVRPKAGYRNLFGNAVRWTTARVGEVSCVEDVCDVQVSVEMRVFSGFAKDLPSFHLFKEKWVREDGGWWYVHQP